jgi:hypothetical protein
MRVVFLDIDGVMNSVEFLGQMIATGTYQRNSLDRSAVAVLNKIVEATGAGFVITSTWRKSRSLDLLRTIFREHGFTGQVIDTTPDLSQLPRGAERLVRGDEILVWLELHPEADEFVIIDDDADMGELIDSLVQVDKAHGLTEAYLDPILHQLTERRVA